MGKLEDIARDHADEAQWKDRPPVCPDAGPRFAALLAGKVDGRTVSRTNDQWILQDKVAAVRRMITIRIVSPGPSMSHMLAWAQDPEQSQELEVAALVKNPRNDRELRNLYGIGQHNALVRLSTATGERYFLCAPNDSVQPGYYVVIRPVELDEATKRLLGRLLPVPPPPVVTAEPRRALIDRMKRILNPKNRRS